MKNWIFLICVSIVYLNPIYAQIPSYKIAKVKYNGGGDWYANKTALPNLSKFCNQNLGTTFNTEETVAEIGSAEIFNYPILYLTGHGNILFSDQEAKNLRQYLLSGGFIHIDDNYGLDKFVRTEMKKVFPELDFLELPASHPIYHQKYSFQNGLPKIHAHDGKTAQGFALIYQGRTICFYTYECDLGNGWEDFGTYPNDTEETRTKALQMGANMVQFAFNQ